MPQYRICVYAICKNEEPFVRGWMESMREADLVVVTDTGSTDGTLEALRAAGATVHSTRVQPWRFDEARNRSLANVPEDVNICVCADLDERFAPGWREKLEAVWQPGATMGNYLYNWSLRPDGSPHTQFVYFKVHARHAYRWKYPVHECLEYIGEGPENKVFVPDMVLNHYPDAAKPRGGYLPLLELGVREMPGDSRMSYYLGREYLFVGRWHACIRELERYLTLGSWKEERAAAMRWIARACAELGEKRRARAWFLRAVAEAPAMRDGYVELAQLAYGEGDWPTVFWACEQALQITGKSTVFTNAGQAWDHTPHDLAAIACFRLGMFSAALQHGKEALDHSPDDPRLQRNLQWYERAVAGQ